MLLKYSTLLFSRIHCSSTHLFLRTAVHCNLSQNGIDHQMCPEDVTSQLEEEEDSVDAGAVLLDNDSPSYPNTSPPMYQRRSPPHRSVSESELTRVRPCAGQGWTAFMPVLSTFIYYSSISLLLIPVCLSCSVSCGPHGGIKD